jgi:SAM-dependent methyltransferase
MTDGPEPPRLYSDLAWLWPLWGDPDGEYADYCEHVVRSIEAHSRREVRTLLNIGCGGGKNLWNLKRRYEATGLDLSPAMLDLARELNPECELVRGDMRSFDLGRTFDAVLVDDAISYMVSDAELRQAFEAAFRHLAPGGVMVVGPDDTKETFVQNRTRASPAEGRARPPNLEVVFVENDYDPDPSDDHYEATMVYLIREDGELRIETDRHLSGLFSIRVWRETLARAGFEVHESEYGEGERRYASFACVRPA